MILMLVQNAWRQLSRDRAAQVLSFIVPLVFFSIFAMIFGGRNSAVNGTSRVEVVVVDESNTDRSRALVQALEADSGLRVVSKLPTTARGGGKPGEPFTREIAERWVKAGDVSVALVLPAGIENSIMNFLGGETVKAIILSDPSDPVGARLVGGLLQRAAMRVNASGGGTLDLRPDSPIEQMMPLRYEERQVLGKKKESPMIAFYAAAIAVMFIMFSAAGAGGALIEETESGTLERVLTTGLGMNGLLLAKWVSLTTFACAQITVMFVWGMLVFKLPLLSHLPGFVMMTVCTGASAAAFGLVLATLSRTRQQLSGLANLLVLGLNAIGGSMFPRFLLPEFMKKISLVGFNAWALEGYLDVFWREMPLTALTTRVPVLIGFTALFLFIARQLARRWESA